jgi:hypothetical protein
MEPSDALHSFRHSLYECLHQRADTLFELTDAILSADAAVPSPVHLSFQPAHRRGWGSFYAALAHGRIDAEVLRNLLARHPLAGNNARLRRGHECGPDATRSAAPYSRLLLPSFSPLGQPIVAGWAYQFIAQLNFVRESWTAPRRGARPARQGRQRGGRQAGEGFAGAAILLRVRRSARNHLGETLH